MPDKPLRIALFTHSVNPRGGVVHALALGEALQARGHAVTLVAPATPGQALFRATRCEVVLLPVPVPPKDLEAMVPQRLDALLPQVAALVAGDRFDVLHAQDTLSGNVLATLAERGAIPHWARTVHHLDVFDSPRLMHWQQRGFATADAVCGVSALWCDTLRRDHGIAARRVHNGVDLRQFSPDAASDDTAWTGALGLSSVAGPRVLAVGGVEARKNTHRLVQAFGLLQKAEAQLALVGGASLLPHDAELLRYQAALHASGLREGPGQPVVRTGPVADAALPALYRWADVLALPSLQEGFGLVALEALASGTPVVVPRRAPFTEHFAPHSPGVHWCEPEDPASIATALKAAAHAPRLHAAPPVCLAHSWDRSAADHEAVYRALIDQRTALAA